MLITAGVYSTRLSRKVQSLYEDGCSIQQIMDETGLKKSSVHGYLPYIKGNYNLPEVTLDAEYSRVYRKRISVCERLRREIDSPDAEEYLWDAIVAYVDYSFITEKGLSLEIYCARRRNLLQPKKEECDQSNCDESVSSGSTAPA